MYICVSATVEYKPHIERQTEDVIDNMNGHQEIESKHVHI